MEKRYDTFRIGITAATTVVRDRRQNGRIIAVHENERDARADARRRNHADVSERIASQRARRASNHTNGDRGA